MWPELEKEEACGNGISGWWRRSSASVEDEGWVSFGGGSGWWRRCRGDAGAGKRRGAAAAQYRPVAAPSLREGAAAAPSLKLPFPNRTCY